VKILCSISGLEFNCEHFPGTFYSKETYHPIFHLEQKRLLPYLKKWAGNELTRTDSYLLFLALLRSSDLVEFRTPVFRTDKTDAIIYNNMEYLARTVIKLNAVQNPAVVFPHFVVTPDTKLLTNVHYWIQNWEHEYAAFASGKARDYDDRQVTRKLQSREAALQRLIKNPHKQISAYANEIAEWAAVAGEFPKGNTISPFSKMQVSLADYWKEVIRRCTKNEYLYTIPKNDLHELIEHCEDYVPAGSIYSNALFKVLRAAYEKHKNFLGLGDMDLKSTYEILEATDDAQSANLKAMIASAPAELPRPEQYSSNFKYMQAKLRWDMAIKYKKEQGNE
jgi:hypothetical protein